MDLSTLRIDSIDVQVPKQSAQLVEQAIAKRDGEIAKLTKEAGESKAKLDTLQGELDGTKKKLEDAVDPKRFDAAVAARIELVDKARKVLGTEEKLDGKSARQLKEMCIQKVTPDIKLDGKSEEYVQALFDTLPTRNDNDDDDLDAGGRKDSDDELGRARKLTSGRQSRSDGGGASSKPSLPAWQQPLAANRTS